MERMSGMKKAKRAPMKVKSKKGSYIMEAAIVLPMIILATITAILIIMFFYSQMTEQCRLHTALRAEAGQLTGKTAYAGHADDAADLQAEIYADRNAMGGEVYGKKYLVMEHKGLLARKGSFVAEGACHAVDGVEYVRYCNMVKGAAGIDE